MRLYSYYSDDTGEVRDKVNEFIKDKKVIDIKFTDVFNGKTVITSAYVLYEDKRGSSK